VSFLTATICLCAPELALSVAKGVLCGKNYQAMEFAITAWFLEQGNLD